MIPLLLDLRMNGQISNYAIMCIQMLNTFTDTYGKKKATVIDKRVSYFHAILTNASI